MKDDAIDEEGWSFWIDGQAWGGTTGLGDLIWQQPDEGQAPEQHSARNAVDSRVNSEESARMITLDGEIRRRMTVMNNSVHRSAPLHNKPSFSTLQPPPGYPLSPLKLQSQTPSDTLSPQPYPVSSATNSSTSSASSQLHRGFLGSVGERSDSGYCSNLNDSLYRVLPPWRPPSPTFSNSVVSLGPATETSEKRLVTRNPGVPSSPEAYFIMDDSPEIFARKVFVGGLPIDVTEEEIETTFSQFGPVLVDWPRRPDTKERSTARYMTGYVFLVFEDERSVQLLVTKCHKEEDKYYLFISSPTMRDKPVQVRPWRLTDMEFMIREEMPINPRRTIFIGGVPRPTKARELARVLDILFGSVCYVGIDIDPELKYPKGAARVTFTTEQSFIAAIRGRFVHIPHADTNKRVEIKPYVMDEQMCDECEGMECAGRYAPYFCGDVSCLQYFCETCWDNYHYGTYSDERRAFHKPLVRVGDQTKLFAHPPHHSHLAASKFVASAVNCCRHFDTTAFFTAPYPQLYLN